MGDGGSGLLLEGLKGYAAVDLHSPVSSFTCIAAFSQLAFQENRVKQKADDCLQLSIVPRLDKKVMTGVCQAPPPELVQVSHGLLWSAHPRPVCMYGSICGCAHLCAQRSSTTPGTLKTKSLFISSQSWHEAYLHLGYTHWDAIRCIPPPCKRGTWAQMDS